MTLLPRLACIRGDGGAAARIANGHGPFERHGATQRHAQLLIVGRGEDAHVGNHAQVDKVENAMMRRAVITHEPRSIKAEDDMGLLQADIDG